MVTGAEQEPKGLLRVFLFLLALFSVGFVVLSSLFLLLGSLVSGSILGALVPVAAMGFAVYRLVCRAREMGQLAIEGQETTGTVIEKRIFRVRSKRYQIKYAYVDACGKEHHHTAWVSRELFESLEVGSPVKVVYLPSRPDVSGLLSDVLLARRALERKGK
jgi:hypothetical protein